MLGYTLHNIYNLMENSFYRIARETADELDELRSLRHVFRNMYRKRLDPRRVMILQSLLPEVLEACIRSITVFVETLRSV